jgi:hypothetical protein
MPLKSETNQNSASIAQTKLVGRSSRLRRQLCKCIEALGVYTPYRIFLTHRGNIPSLLADHLILDTIAVAEFASLILQAWKGRH